jgi:hypothetical protein
MFPYNGLKTLSSGAYGFEIHIKKRRNKFLNLYICISIYQHSFRKLRNIYRKKTSEYDSSKSIRLG